MGLFQGDVRQVKWCQFFRKGVSCSSSLCQRWGEKEGEREELKTIKLIVLKVSYDSCALLLLKSFG